MKIKELKLFTSSLINQDSFYSNILGLQKINSSSKDEIAFIIGNSVLRFIKREITTPYHLAINIFSNQEHNALEWLKERVTILKDGKNEIQNFDSWNAKAIYFYDEDKNIVEFIARKNLNRNSNDPFSSNSLIEISEIGLATLDIEKVYNKLNDQISLEIYSGSFDDFCAIGNEHGLFICVNQQKKKWFPINDNVYFSDFDTEIVNTNKYFLVSFKNGSLKITEK